RDLLGTGPYRSTTPRASSERPLWVRRNQYIPAGGDAPALKRTRWCPAPSAPTSRVSQTRPVTSSTSSRADAALGSVNEATSSPIAGFGRRPSSASLSAGTSTQVSALD